ncbi:hypothetical protein CGK74_09085 [Thauera propionica]|jgi:hypothetical protein|uniref:RNA polymerase sigma-70 region 4 domain-containing protein n=1 Tax=Thauera propionica TaxID=2019431 RepID=A0A235F0G5_9RHOO|nr:hypothetical protein [Thauera propionica]OYD54327.1 hypothetical protein CGK74_09085 [Thauera propionica]
MSLEIPIDEVQFARMTEIARHAEPGFFAVANHDEIAAALAAEEGTKPLSRARIAQIEREALRKLRRILEARGILSPDDMVP